MEFYGYEISADEIIADVMKDEEGVATMRILGKNMAYLLKALDAAKKAGIPLPEQEPNVRTNFIR